MSVSVTVSFLQCYFYTYSLVLFLLLHQLSINWMMIIYKGNTDSHFGKSRGFWFAFGDGIRLCSLCSPPSFFVRKAVGLEPSRQHHSSCRLCEQFLNSHCGQQGPLNHCVRTHTHMYTHTHSHSLCFSLSFSLSHTHTHTHTHMSILTIQSVIYTV